MADLLDILFPAHVEKVERRLIKRDFEIDQIVARDFPLERRVDLRPEFIRAFVGFELLRKTHAPCGENPLFPRLHDPIHLHLARLSVEMEVVLIFPQINNPRFPSQTHKYFLLRLEKLGIRLDFIVGVDDHIHSQKLLVLLFAQRSHFDRNLATRALVQILDTTPQIKPNILELAHVLNQLVRHELPVLLVERSHLLRVLDQYFFLGKSVRELGRHFQAFDVQTPNHYFFGVFQAML